MRTVFPPLPVQTEECECARQVDMNLEDMEKETGG